MFYTNSQPFPEIFSNVCPCNYLHLRLKFYTYLGLFFLTLLVSQSAICSAVLFSVIGKIRLLRLVSFVFTTWPIMSSFGENFRDGSRHQLSTWIASSKWSGHCFGKSSVGIFSASSLSKSRVHSHLSMCKNSLFIPLTNLLTQGEYLCETRRVVKTNPKGC